MKRQRVQAIILQDMKALFGFGKITQDTYGHFFIGGGVEQGETPEEAILREIKEEANVDGRIIFKFRKELKENHHTFLVDIGEQQPLLGYDPEEEEISKADADKALQKLQFISLEEINEFTKIDADYFRLLLDECNSRSYYPEWYGRIELISKSQVEIR